MPHDRIPDMLGRVLSGSKYGVRQTRWVRLPACGAPPPPARLPACLPACLSDWVVLHHVMSRHVRGKFGLGSKMALIWSKKSTGMPIEIESAHSTDKARVPSQRSHCVLDIDIYRNEPQVRVHRHLPNADGWRGSKITVVVEGNWTTYKSHTMHYFQQLAIITPYAELDVTFR
jgi:DNA topoisomerase VI subunit B